MLISVTFAIVLLDLFIHITSDLSTIMTTGVLLMPLQYCRSKHMYIFNGFGKVLTALANLANIHCRLCKWEWPFLTNFVINEYSLWLQVMYLGSVLSLHVQETGYY